MRIVSGKHKSKKIRFPLGDQTRPTKDRIRESIFNILMHASWCGQNIENSYIMDVFAGSGSLGFEAISRGAIECIFIDNHSEAELCCKENAKEMAIENKCLFIKSDIENLKPRPTNLKKRNFVFLDPPYSKGLGEKALKILVEKDWFADDAIIILEMAKNAPETVPQCFTLLEQRSYGIATIYFLAYNK